MLQPTRHPPHQQRPGARIRISALSPNPFGIEAAGPILSPFAGFVGFRVLTAGIVAAVASLLSRFRTARGEQRQQLKWFAYAAALMGLWIVENFTLNALAPSLTGTPIHTIPALLAYAAIPTAAGIAILRYRLYDIDVIINRTLVYSTLTAGVVFEATDIQDALRQAESLGAPASHRAAVSRASPDF